MAPLGQWPMTKTRLSRPAAAPAPVPARRSYFAGAAGGRLLADWINAPLIAARDESKLSALPLRGRGREMVRNDPIFARYVRLLADMVAGPDGIRTEPRLYAADGTLLRTESRELGYQFQRWGERATCTRDKRLSWPEFQQQVVKLTPPEGEAFVRLHADRRNPFGLSLELIDPDLVNQELTQLPTPDRPAIYQGIELDAFGAAAAYWVWQDYDHRLPMVRIAAEQMLHLFWPNRPGAVRGLCHFAPVMMPARMLRGYREAELVASRASSAKMGFLERTNPELIAEDENDTSPRQLPTEAAPGTIEELPIGYTYKPNDPQHPTTAYKDYVQSQEGEIAAGLHHSRITLFADWSSTNYSSGRMPVRQEQDHYRTWQRWEIEGLCRPVYQRWVELAWLKGAITLPTGDPSANNEAAYIPRGFGLYNPGEDIDVVEKMLRLRLTTRSRESARLGDDWEEVLEQTEADDELADDYGVDLTLPAPAAQQKTPQTGDSNGQGEETAADGAAAGGADRSRRLRLG